MLKINPKITSDIIEEAYKSIKNLGLLKLEDMNAAFHKYLIEGVPVSYRANGEQSTFTVHLIDFENPQLNDFKVINQYTIIEYKNKRPDVLIFINGIPMVLFELKNMVNADTTVEDAYKQIKNYQLDIPTLFYYNAFNVISDGLDTRAGTITSDFTRYMTWKSENGERPEESGVNYFTTLINGVFPKERILDIICNFIVVQDSKGKTMKIMAGYHQYFAVRRAVERTKKSIEENSRKVGVVWHTQGSGKSLSMVFYTGCIVSDPQFHNPTIVVLTDRNDLDNQLFGTFCASSKLLLRQTPKQAQNRENLKELLRVNAGGIIFTTIQKFKESSEILSERSNIIFMADEAHRSQYGLDGKLDRNTGEWKYGMAKYMRDSLPNATFIGFTGTPIDFDDKSTVEVFGDYIDIYDMTQAVEDGATVPIYYENRTAKLKLNADLLKKIDAEYDKLEAEASEIAIEKSKSDLSSIEAIIGSKERLGMLADDIIGHYEDRQYVLTGKAMIVCMTRRIAINLYKIILEKRPEWKNKIKVVNASKNELATLINKVMTVTYWSIGKYIVEFEQDGNAKAAYGKNLLSTISKELTLRLGKGYSRPNLNNMRKFYLKYSNCQTVSDKLSWSHICELIKIDDELERSFYEKECVVENWNVRTLRRQMDSALFLRLASSRDKEGILKLAPNGIECQSPEDIVKSTYTLEFLDIPEQEKYSVNDLEQKIIDNLQKFLLELGKGFTFVKRQYPLTINNVHYHVDLVFYHRILKCFVLIDLKKNSVQHEDIGQMNMYMGYFAIEENMPDDNPPIGIILSKNKDELLVEYATYGMDSNLFVSKYELYLPNRKELEKLVKDILDDEEN